MLPIINNQPDLNTWNNILKIVLKIPAIFKKMLFQQSVQLINRGRGEDTKALSAYNTAYKLLCF